MAASELQSLAAVQLCGRDGMKYRLRQVSGFAADVPAPTDSKENLSLQQFVSQNGILTCIYGVRSLGFGSFSSVKKNQIDLRRNRSIFEAIF